MGLIIEKKKFKFKDVFKSAANGELSNLRTYSIITIPRTLKLNKNCGGDS